MTKKKRKGRKQAKARAKTSTPRATVEAAGAPASDGRVVVELVTALVEQLLGEPLLAGDHRSHTRVALEAEIDLASESHFFSGLSGDLSEGGLFVETYRDVEVGSEVAVAFSLPNGAVKAQGSVRWRRLASDSSPPGVGIAFDHLSDVDKALIHTFCAARAPLYYDVDHAS